MKSTLINNSNMPPVIPNNGKGALPSLIQLLTSKEWTEYFHSLSKMIRFDLNVYSEEGNQLFSTGKNSFCEFVKSTLSESIRCPESCNKSMFEALKSNKPVTYKCCAKIINFSLPVERFSEKALIVGRGGFVSYEDFLAFLKISKDNNLLQIPVTLPLNFLEEDYVKTVSQYAHNTLSYLLNNLENRYRLEEKIGRLTTLLNAHTFETLSKNRDLMYRYILDTIEFILGHTSTAMMVLDYTTSTYKTLYSTGKHKDALKGFQLDSENEVIYEILSARATVYSVDTGRLITAGPLKGIDSLYFFPIFISDTIEGLIGIFDKELSQEDIKIINAFRDYIQVTFENQSLRVAVDKKANEILASLSEISRSLAPVLSAEPLFRTILEKSIHLLNAEQGSLMLLDQESSELIVEAKKGLGDVVRKNMRLPKEGSIAGHVFESRGSLLVQDIERDPRTRQKNRPHYKTKSFVSVPLKIEDRVVGVLNISDKISGEVFNEDDLKLIQSFATNAAIAIERSFFYKQVEDLKKLSVTDPLTGIYNRRYLNNRLTEEVSRYKRYKLPFSFLMLDIDGFKEYNDTFGHIAGDRVLRTLATTMVRSLRTVDIAARFGGDEFVIIFPQTPKVDAVQSANRLKEKIEKAYYDAQMELPFGKLTVSMGLATYPDDAMSIKELIEKTDQALYLAKKGGGNRVVHL